MDNGKFDNPKKAKRRPLLIRMLLSVFMMPLISVPFGGISFGSPTGDNPLLGDDAGAGAPAETGIETQPTGGQAASSIVPAGTEQLPAPAPAAPAAGQEPAPVQPASPTASSILEKLKAAGVTKFVDEDSVVKSYTSMEQLSSRMGTENAQLKGQLDNMIKLNQELMQRFPAPSSQPNNPQQSQQPAAPTPEDVEKQNSEFIENLMSNPMETLTKFFSDSIKPVISQELKPIQDFKTAYMTDKTIKEWDDKTAKFANEADEAGALKRPDFKDVWPDMVNVFKTIPSLVNEENALDFAYNYAKGTHAGQQGSAPAVDPQQLLQDKNFVDNFVLNDQNIANAILAKHMQGIQNGNPPTVIGSASGGQPVVVPPDTPRDLSQATSLWKKAMGILGK
jgi:hypothetical protein